MAAIVKASARLGLLADDAPPVWVDHRGREWTVSSGAKLHCSERRAHAALRAFVALRDGFRCVWCGVRASNVPDHYDGRGALAYALASWFHLDHIISRRNGGAHHPDNLQTLCGSCNSAKAGLVDAKRGVA